MTRSRLSIRARITGGSLLIALLVSTFAGIVIFAQVQRIVQDGQMRVLKSVEGPYLTAIDDADTIELEPPGPGQYVGVIAPNGVVALNTLPRGLAGDVDALAAAGSGIRTVDDVTTPYVVRVTPVAAESGVWSVVTAIPNDQEVLEQVAWLLIASIAGINLAFAGASWWIGTAALRPVARLRRSAAELARASQTRLLPVGPARDEVSDLATTLNELIGQLRASAERERQIVSDASHEFRTPIAIIQTRLELAQREAQTLDDMRVDVAAAQRTLARLSALATSMLDLSRIDAQMLPGHTTCRALAHEFSDAVDRARLHAAGRHVRIDYTENLGASEDRIAVSDADFGRVCDNLIGNALAVVGEHGVIELTLLREEDAVRLTVADDGGGMDSDYVAHAFDRFSRSAPSRTGMGAGLGLAIVAGISALGGGVVELDNRPGEGLRVIVTFPFTRGPGERAISAVRGRDPGTTPVEGSDGDGGSAPPGPAAPPANR